MEKNETKMKLPKISADDLFTTQAERDLVKQGQIIELSLNNIVDFPEHPFKVVVNKELEEMADSIKEYGVLHPVIVRPKNDGKYEMIAGHRRKKATELAELSTIPCIVKDLTDDEATIIMVDSNLQREKLLPSEKAFAYKMKMEALKHQGKRTDLTSVQLEQKLISRDEVGKEQGDSGATVRRYIRLTELIPELLEFVDNEKIAISPAVELSYLTEEEQFWLLDTMECFDATPSLSQAIQMKKLSQEKNLTVEKIEKMLEQEKPNQIPKIRINRDRLQNVLPHNLLSDKEVEDFVVKCVEDFVKRQKQKSLER